MNTNCIRLGIEVKDIATGLTGTLTHMQASMDGALLYLFQPKALNADTKQPVKRLWLVPQRLKYSRDDVRVVDLPTKILGTTVRDKATGFEGIAINLILHINGCVHVEVQPRGTLRTGDPIEFQDFDIRRLAGPAIKAMTREEQDSSERRTPSPAGMTSAAPRMR